MLKINLSGDKEDKSRAKEAETIVAHAAKETPAASIQDPPELAVEESSGPSNRTRLLLLLALLAVSVLAYTQKDSILGLFGTDKPAPSVVTAPPPPKPKPAPAPAAMEPDPVFVTLNAISGTVPQRVWLTSMVVSNDGKYEIKGMAFSHEAIAAMIAALNGLGAVDSSTVPPKSKSPEAVYSFVVAGTVTGMKIPEVLDLIPSDTLVQMCGTLSGKEKEYRITFAGLPKAGVVYKDQDMPFMLSGSFEGLKKVIADLCPESGNVRVFRLVVSSAAPGRSFDLVRASFSLRTVSAI